MNWDDYKDRQSDIQAWLDQKSVLKHLIDNSCDLISVVDAEGTLLYALPSNQGFTGVVPANAQELIELVHDDNRTEVQRTFLKLLQSRKAATVEYRYKDKNDEWLWVESTGVPIPYKDGRLSDVVLLSRDISKRKIMEERLIQMAFHDPLTGLSNRRLFSEHLNHALAFAKRSKQMLAILCIDIDDFKFINDSMGHDVGDEFLKAFAERVKGCVRETDTFSRMGGDEFTILLPTIDTSESVVNVVNRIFNALKADWQLRDCTFTSTVSMGIVMYPHHGEDETTLLKNVDIALYQVKNNGGNNYCIFSPDLER